MYVESGHFLLSGFSPIPMLLGKNRWKIEDRKEVFFWNTDHSRGRGQAYERKSVGTSNEHHIFVSNTPFMCIRFIFLIFIVRRNIKWSPFLQKFYSESVHSNEPSTSESSGHQASWVVNTYYYTLVWVGNVLKITKLGIWNAPGLWSKHFFLWLILICIFSL